jgi:hypothetical protein
MNHGQEAGNLKYRLAIVEWVVEHGLSMLTNCSSWGAHKFQTSRMILHPFEASHSRDRDRDRDFHAKTQRRKEEKFSLGGLGCLGGRYCPAFITKFHFSFRQLIPIWLPQPTSASA